MDTMRNGHFMDSGGAGGDAAFDAEYDEMDPTGRYIRVR